MGLQHHLQSMQGRTGYRPPHATACNPAVCAWLNTQDISKKAAQNAQELTPLQVAGGPAAATGAVKLFAGSRAVSAPVAEFSWLIAVTLMALSKLDAGLGGNCSCP